MAGSHVGEAQMITTEQGAVEGGFTGELFAVNPQAKEIEDITSYPSIGDVSADPVMMAVPVRIT